MLLDAFFRSDTNDGPGNLENPATPLTGENIAEAGVVNDVYVSPETRKAPKMNAAPLFSTSSSATASASCPQKKNAP